MLRIRQIALFLILITTFASCAKRGFISGGDPDTIPPVMLKSTPANYSTQFDEKIIKIQFDEYIKLKNINQQLIVSPPMETAPEISPMGSPKKELTIKIIDTLKANTTYSFNFGESITDNNEGNALKQFKYIFSTGTYIDSLQVKGSIRAAFKKNHPNFVNVMLYDAADFGDSTVYKQKPLYVTNTLDSLKNFSLENIKEGSYYMVALKDKNNNFKFDPEQDEIAFLKDPISIPTEDTFALNLFKSQEKLKVNRPAQLTQNKWYLPYIGNPEKLEVKIKHANNEVLHALTRLPGKDTLQIWFPKMEVDSLLMEFKAPDYEQLFTVRPRKIKTEDTLSVSAVQRGNLDFRDSFTLRTATPFAKIDSTKILITNKDSVAVAFKIAQRPWLQELSLDFEKAEDNKYKIQLLPEALTDFFGKSNDSLKFEVSTKKYTDYGNLIINLGGAQRFPIIVEVLNSKEEVVASLTATDSSPLRFEILPPQKYFLRAIYDDNQNGQWDSGYYFDRRQPEEVIYYPAEIDVRANWDVDQLFNLTE
ncbi:Ig-like domain-containing protein [Flavobacterium sp. JP2137]|uniref:Ig-like domain-containing protein n=1 Tax=Flavobacterium sp. JP2137 TaxID=3414510 RepID=UPI003D2FC91E